MQRRCGMAWRRRMVVQATGIELCKWRVFVLFHSGTTRGGALILSVYMHTQARLTQENWQILSTIGWWLAFQALPFIIGGHFQVEPWQLEGSGWVRAVCGFVVAPQLATVTPSHRVIDFFVVSRDLASACEEPRKSLSTLHLTGPSEMLFPRGPAVRPSGCRKRECDLDWDPVRRCVQAAFGAQAGVDVLHRCRGGTR